MSVDITKFIEESLAAGKGWKSEEEKQAYFDSIENCAIFAEDTTEMNQYDIDAFNNMIYDNRTPAELLDNFRDRGNTHFKTGKRNRMFYRDALVMYGKALQQSRLLEQEYQDSPEGKEEISKLWSNCAAANLNLRNWRSALQAAEVALELWEENVKAVYRKTKALIELKRYEEAVLSAAQGAALDAENKEFPKLQKQAQKRFVEARRQEEARAAAVLRRQQPVLDLWELAQSVRVRLGPPDKSMREMAGGHAIATAKPSWAGEGANRDVRWPLLLLYPEYSQTDFVAEAHGQDMLAEWLGRVLPEEEQMLPEWDERRDYRGSNVDVFFKLNAAFPIQSEDEMLEAFGAAESAAAKDAVKAKRGTPEEQEQAWVQVHPGCSLAQIVAHQDHVLVGGIVALTVVPRGSSAHARFMDDAKEYTRGVEHMLEPGQL
uniref:Cns1/TTC4 wheel domain-containing protein n=1 Tax=Phaeomonas parva TaxID=124430 RepID=A0A7S1XL21_9STRA|mmetsp:Transcript_17998/g.55071  ORF Transcript_17998/g.55071 Transcript_17998/m.55071 type:complete len:432 (+) Transcript_17998:430-1725(+)|eukprot:CAMPEP_0118852204 /NCGR_PEP_ID=MMETSP1163-20130328/1318_1 /TAXON_ID=124430 /ORGANISM="Phaeomonas parva, Strain CCMP2877" /LENGTH=431 /DNA_ID=CAMNT_0006784613 /DNA_START=376 /DNA_END=1671 /DNA_ORIENTATION=+